MVYVTLIQVFIFTWTSLSWFVKSEHGTPADPADCEEVAKHHEAVGSLRMPLFPCALEEKTEEAVGDLKGTYA